MPEYANRWDDKSTYDSYNLLCPYCGHEHDDAWERFHSEDDSPEIECGRCEKTFMGRMSKTFTYYGCPAIEEATRR